MGTCHFKWVTLISISNFFNFKHPESKQIILYQTVLWIFQIKLETPYTRKEICCTHNEHTVFLLYDIETAGLFVWGIVVYFIKLS